MNGTISIGGSERSIVDASPNWINEQLGHRQESDASTCVRVAIHDSDVNVALATAACGGRLGGGRVPNPKEMRVIDLWNKHHLGDANYPRGQLVAFVQE